MKYVYDNYIDHFRRRLEIAQRYREVLYIVLDDGEEWAEFKREMDFKDDGGVLFSTFRFNGIDVIPASLEAEYRAAQGCDEP